MPGGILILVAGYHIGDPFLARATTKNGTEFVFKPELDSRIGLSILTFSKGNAYKDAQKTANLNLATQDTAKAFGCEDLVVKYSVGSHDGQFGVFMEKAKGFTGEDFHRKKKDKGDGIAPTELKTKIPDDNERAAINLGSFIQV